MTRGVLRFVGQLVAWVVILGAIAAIAVAVVIPRVGGATPYTVLTGSMRPHYPPGTLVVSKPIDPDKLTVGDVVTYQIESGEPEVVTHRIVSVTMTGDGKREFTTQGDANPAADEKRVKPVQVRGKLWYAVPFLGRLNVLFDRKQHQKMVYVAAGLLAAYALWMFGGSARDGLRRRKKPGEAPVGGRHADRDGEWAERAVEA